MSSIVLDSVGTIKNEDDKYPQSFLEECGYEDKKPNKYKKYIEVKILICNSDEIDDGSIE